MEAITAKTPWANQMDQIPMHLDYFEGSMVEKVMQIAEQYPNNIAFDFMGKHTTYRQMVREIERCARALKTIGIRENDKVTIAMPNCPQAIYMFYAVNLVGAIGNMIHPLSAEKEIEFYLNESESVTAITLDQFYHKFEHIRENTKVVNIIIASVKDALSKPVRAGYMLTEGRKIKKIPKDAPVIRWKEFMHLAEHCFYNYKVSRPSNAPAVILYSGGTTRPDEPELQRPLPADHRHEPHVQARRQDALGHAALPRFRSRRLHPLDAGPGRPLHPGAALHGPELRQAHHQVPLQLHRRRPDPV